MSKVINAAIHGTGTDTDTLTGKADSEGLTVSFDGEAPCFVSWKSFKQLLSFRLAQGMKEGKSTTDTVTPLGRTQVVQAPPASGPNVATPMK